MKSVFTATNTGKSPVHSITAKRAGPQVGISVDISSQMMGYMAEDQLLNFLAS